MDMDEDDDIYVPEEPQDEPIQQPVPVVAKGAAELEEGEEEDEGGAMEEDDDDDSDIDIITERKDGTKAAPPIQTKYSDIRNIPQRSGAQDSPGKLVPTAPVKPEANSAAAAATTTTTTKSTATTKTPYLAVPSADQEAAAGSRSTVDINANPIYEPVGKPITQVNIDEDLPDNEKPWRKPGADISDYFNYGFDEFTWALYAAKQESVRGEFGADAFAVNNKKMMEDFNSMMMMGGMGVAGNSGGGGGGSGNNMMNNHSNNNNNTNNNNAVPSMPGMEGIPPEMQQMMQQMMASGMDPSQMDVNQMSSMFAAMQNAGNAGGGAAQGGGYGVAQGGYGGYNQGGGGRGRRGRW